MRDLAYSWGSARALARSRPPEKTLHPEHMLEYALHWAAGFRRGSVVEFLLARNPDLKVREPMWNSTILGTATYGGDPDIIRLIRALVE